MTLSLVLKISPKTRQNEVKIVFSRKNVRIMHKEVKPHYFHGKIRQIDESGIGFSP